MPQTVVNHARTGRRRRARDTGVGLVTALLTAAATVGLAAPATAAPGDVVTVPDPELSVCLHHELGLDATEPLTEAGLAGLTSLHCWQDITSLAGLDHATGLTSLRFVNAGRLSDLGPLAGLSRLTFLSFDTDARAVADLRPLAGLTELTTLVVPGSKVRDVSPLKGLTRLTTLDLSQSRVLDARPLAGFGCGTSLDLTSQYGPLAPAVVAVPTPFEAYDTAGRRALVDEAQGGITDPDPTFGRDTVTYPTPGVWQLRFTSSDPCPVHHYSTLFEQQVLTPRARDLTGDRKVDLAVYRPSTSTFSVRGQAARRWGETGDVPAAGHYDGLDRPAVVGVMRPAQQWLVQGRTVPTNAFILDGMVPVPGDYDGDGADEVTGFWGGWWTRWGGQEVVFTTFGEAGDVPVPADYDGDGVTDRAVFRPSTGEWLVQGGSTTKLGRAGDVPVPADLNGDGRAEPVVFRPSTGRWYARGRASVRFGKAGDAPVPGDYDGNGKAELAVFRAATGQWLVRGRTTVRFGRAGDVPI